MADNYAIYVSNSNVFSNARIQQAAEGAALVVGPGQQAEPDPLPGAACARFQPTLHCARTLQHLSIPPESIWMSTAVFAL